jgi:hypothetical protein
MKMNLARSLCRGAAIALIWGSATLRSAVAEDLGTPAGHITVPTGFTRGQVRDAIVSALAGRGWSVTAKTDDRVTGYLKRHGNEATLTLTYTKTTVDLYCVGFQVNKKTGVREKPEQPHSWLNYIRTDLTRLLNPPVPPK